MADKPIVLSEHITDENQQVHVVIDSAKAIEGDLFAIKAKFSDGRKCEGEMLSNGGRVPEKGQEWKLQLEARKAVPTEVVVKDKDGKDTEKTEIELQDRPVVVGYSL